ncbi:transporter substrate-binding domain-containing protein [Aeromonas sp. 1HA1]|uniref:transporter substrate-binding domain-containing protein n=1 Tax=Aeromonas sp. 1HA1 TaxID=2699193 RepID=UPI0023DD801D|nr:transporter substrate-binding domain-containing protein [Aeromonas sp. 1HA1]MDF2412202.1 transporter substrate-binding domain-containing protein [Aeromonas sp. 1HA1]
MLRLCYRAFLLCWLACWSLAAAAETGLDKDRMGLSERLWLATRSDLVVGMPSVAWPPYVYANSRGGYSGPLDDFASLIASRLGLTLRYKTYPYYAGAQQALLDGEVDMLLGVTPSQSRQQQMLFTSDLVGMPRGILLAKGNDQLTLPAARQLRWVCEHGFSSCETLAELGMAHLAEADSSEEAVFMVKRGLADAYLADLPALVRLQRLQQQANLKVITPDWVTDTSVAIAVGPSNQGLQGLLELALNDIPLNERRRILETGGIVDYELANGPRQIIFNQSELEWLAQHPTLRFGVAPDWPAVSEIDGSGQFKGFLADLLKLLSMRSGLQFTLVPTSSWAETQALFKAGKLDLIPAMTPTPERRQFSLFTPEYAFIHRLLVARHGEVELEDLNQLKGRRVGIVAGTIEKSLLKALGAYPVTVSNDTRLLPLLGRHEVDYVLMSMQRLQLALQKGFNNRYQVVFSGNELRVPIAMATHQQDPMLQQILTKVLLSIRPDELSRLEQKWFSLTIQTGINPATVMRWSFFGIGAFLLSALLFIGWNRTLRRQIVQRQLAEDKLNEQLTFVQTLLNSLPNMVALRNSEQCITLSNQAYRDAFIGAKVGDDYDDLDDMPPQEQERVLREELEVWQSGEQLEGAGYSRRQDGAMFHVIYTKRPYRSPNGDMLGVLTVLTDVTRIKEAEARARQAETRLTQITDSMPGIVYQYLWQGPGKGRFLYASQGASEILGASQQDMLSAESGGEVFGFTEEALQDFVSKLANHAETLARLDLEVRVERPEGDRYLQVRGSFVPQDEGNLILNGVIQDITALKRQENDLREARAYAEQAMQVRSRFLATMSHELRTPISGMHGMLELLQMSELNEDQRYMLRNVITSTNNLLYLVNDVLDFSKIEAGQLQLHYQDCRLSSVICDVIRGHATLAHGKGLKVALEWAREVPDQARIDAMRVGQVLSNLLNNAVKFTELGEIRIQVSYHAEQLFIAVSDTGIGIAEEKQDRLFTPFEQVESDITRRFGGTGLGLAICHQLAQKMGGSLALESKPGQGTRLTFGFPLTECQWDAPPLAGQQWWLFGEDAALQSAMQRLGARLNRLDPQQWQQPVSGLLLAEEGWLEQALGSEWSTRLQQSALKGIVLSPLEALRGRMDSDAWWRLGQSPLYPDLLLETCHQLLGEKAINPVQAHAAQLQGRVLVADDHPINRALLARQLGILGVDAEVVDDGEKALRTWQGQDFSLLLTDCHMPVMDGYTLTRTLRAQGEQAPIIGVTADTSEGAGLQMQQAGMNDMLFKPYTLNTLRQMLARWLPAVVPADEAADEAAPQSTEPARQQGERWISLFGDDEVARSMAQEYLDSNRQDGDDMMQAVACQDTHALVETAHRIKGAARMVGQLALAEEAARLEAAARLKQLEELTELSQTVLALMNSITREIGLWLDEQNTA